MKKLAILILGTLLLVSGLAVWKFGGTPPEIASEIAAAGDPSASAGSEEKFIFLSQNGNNTCGLQAASVSAMGDEEHIYGSCCAPMDEHAYREQIEGLEKYSDLSFIPSDPYDITAAQAKPLFAFQAISLTADQQAIYNEAMKLSDEGGPCCCKCWHWDVYDGLAKKLIADYNWTAEQIAELWDLSSACGGPGHMHE